MRALELEHLLSFDQSAFELNGISKELLNTIDEIILNSTNNIGEDVIGIYKKFVSMKQNAPDYLKNDLFRVMKNFITEKKQKKEVSDALLMCRFLIVKSKLQPSTYYDISEILIAFGKHEQACEFIKLYEQCETNKPLGFLTIGNFYNFQIKDYKTAISYYEQYLKIDETKSVIYTILANLYAKEYGDQCLKEQIYYFEKAYKLTPKNRLVLHGLAFNSEKFGDKNKANRYYKELLENNPTPTDYYNYGAFLISCGDFEKGHQYFRYRFETNSIDLQYPITTCPEKKWDLHTDISNKTLLVHYEQGFGDTFMYCRFLPELKKIAKKIIFIAQPELQDLLRSSKTISNEIEITSEDIINIEYDFHMSLLDAPYVLKTTISTIPYCNKYLEVSDDLVQEYGKKYIKPSKNLRVGIAYQGNKTSNYHERDIDFSSFKSLLKLDNVDFYSLSKDRENEEGIISLGFSFNNFTDTACAIQNMDIVLSTDNVILNLSGSLGKNTLGLFNKNANFRWFKLTGDTGWYNSVKVLQSKEINNWRSIFSEITNILTEYSNKKSEGVDF